MEKEFLKSISGIEISDMNFKHHIQNQTGLNIFIISLQIVIFITSLIISGLTGLNLSKYSACITFVLLIVVFANNIISKKAWDISKKRQDKIIAMYDIIDDNELSEEEKYLHLCNIKGHKMVSSDIELGNLVNKWYKNINRKPKKLKYRDANGVRYSIGDIVYNPVFGDLWLVEELSKEDMLKFGFNIPYVFTLYGNPEEHIMELDEPYGFRIESSVSNLYDYINNIINFSKVYKIHKNCIEEIDTSLEKDDDIDEK